jgi:hypothetical protein
MAKLSSCIRLGLPTGLVSENAHGYEIEMWIMLFATAIGGRLNGKEQYEA